jgi:hypothetical protein
MAITTGVQGWLLGIEVVRGKHEKNSEGGDTQEKG